MVEETIDIDGHRHISLAEAWRRGEAEMQREMVGGIYHVSVVQPEGRVWPWRTVVAGAILVGAAYFLLGL